MDKIHLQLRNSSVQGSVKLSGSKSISNRLLLMSRLANAENQFENLSDSNDTVKIIKGLREITVCSASRIPLIVDSGNAGTVFRFLVAFLAREKGKWLITGDARMKQRPIKSLVDALQELGAKISYSENRGFPPLQIEGGFLNGRKVQVDASKSSQFVTSLMLIAPYFDEGLEIELLNKPVSFPYVQMTMKLMKQCAIKVKLNGNTIIVQPGRYEIKERYIEPDWSSASYWYQFVALADDAEIFLPGFSKKSIQGDSICAELFENLGVKTEFEKSGMRLKSVQETEKIFELDFTNHPDLVPAVMATCAAKQIKATFKGVGHLKYKESDRMKSLSNELAKVGATFDFKKDDITLVPDQKAQSKTPLVFNTYADHRLAMCLAPLVLRYKNIVINDPEVVSKSYPAFWEDIKRLGFVDVEEN